MVPALGLPVQKLAMARILVKQEVMNVDESQQDLTVCFFASTLWGLAQLCNKEVYGTTNDIHCWRGLLGSWKKHVLLIRCWRCVSWQYFAAFCTVSVSSAKTKPTSICKANCIRMKARNYQKHSPCPSCRILGKAFHLHSIDDRRCLGIPWRLSESMPQDKLNHWTCWLFCCVVWCQTEVPTLCQPRNW